MMMRGIERRERTPITTPTAIMTVRIRFSLSLGGVAMLAEDGEGFELALVVERVGVVEGDGEAVGKGMSETKSLAVYVSMSSTKKPGPFSNFNVCSMLSSKPSQYLNTVEGSTALSLEPFVSSSKLTISGSDPSRESKAETPYDHFGNQTYTAVPLNLNIALAEGSFATL